MKQSGTNRFALFLGGLAIGVVLAGRSPALANTDTQPCATVDETTASAAVTGTTNAATTETTNVAVTNTAATTTAAAMTDTVTPVTTAHLRLTELFPNPAGEDTAGEFFEIQNAGTTTADLAGWTVVSASNKSFSLPAAALAAGAYLSFPYTETHLVLTNSNATYSLIAPDGTTVDSTSYGTAPDGKSYARAANGDWAWNRLPTPGTANDEAGFAAVSTTAAASSAAASNAATSSTSSTSTATTTADATTVTTSSAVPVPPIASAPTFRPADIVVTAFLPRPASGGFEWIEVENRGPVSAALIGWRLDDLEGGSKPFALDGVTMAAGERRRFAQAESRLGLNDDGDDVRLLAADGTIAFATSYVKAPIGQTRLNIEGAWQWENELPVAYASIASETAASSPAGDAAPPTVTQEQPVPLSAMTAGTQVIAATVTLPPGKIGSNTFAVQTDDGVGMFVRVYGKGFPKLERGSRLMMTARVTMNEDLASATVRAKDLEAAGPGTLSEPITTELITPLENGRLVLLRGTVTGGGKRWLTVSPDGLDDDVTVTLVGGSVPSGKHEGETAEVTGVARLRGEKVELLAEGTDLKLTPATLSEEIPLDSADFSSPPQPNPEKNGPSLPAVATPLGGAAASAYALWRKRKGVVDIPS